MVKVITYGTYDLLHYGHIKLLERAKALGDYLIVGVTADDFDKKRGKINVRQSLMERVEAVRSTGIADEIIIEEYEGQKIDDIIKYDINIFTVGSDWKGKFDYLKEYCEVVYLDRTDGVSSTEIRNEKDKIVLGLMGEHRVTNKFLNESKYVNGLEAVLFDLDLDYAEQLDGVDAVYLVTKPNNHFEQIKIALNMGKHVLCETPISLTSDESEYLHRLATKKNCVLMDGIKTAYSTAYSRMLLMFKGGIIGEIVSIDVTATSQLEIKEIKKNNINNTWNSINAWGPTVMLPVFQLLGTAFKKKIMVSKMLNDSFDLFTSIYFVYDNAVANVKVGKGVKSEGELIISGTKGYIYVPAPWWKMDYFEVRYENPKENKRFFYQLDGEGIRYELLAFVRTIETAKANYLFDKNISDAICNVIEDFYEKKDFIEIS